MGERRGILEEETDLSFEQIDINALPDTLQMTVQDISAISFLLKNSDASQELSQA